MKLFKVVLRGLLSSNYGTSYVVATDPTKAYSEVRKFLDGNNYGFVKDRGLHTIELIADTEEYADAGSVLFLPEEKGK